MEQQLTINFMNENQKKYSEADLLMFKSIIEKKLASANQLLVELKEVLTGTSENGTDDTHRSFKQDDGAQNSTKDETTILAHKQELFIFSLQNALIRIEKGTYGVCVKTGELIDRNRLMAVPNTTTSLVVKIEMQNTYIPNPDISNGE